MRFIAVSPRARRRAGRRARNRRGPPSAFKHGRAMPRDICSGCCIMSVHSFPTWPPKCEWQRGLFLAFAISVILTVARASGAQGYEAREKNCATSGRSIGSASSSFPPAFPRWGVSNCICLGVHGQEEVLRAVLDSRDPNVVKAAIASLSAMGGEDVAHDLAATWPIRIARRPCAWPPRRGSASSGRGRLGRRYWTPLQHFPAMTRRHNNSGAASVIYHSPWLPTSSRRIWRRRIHPKRCASTPRRRLQIPHPRPCPISWC